MTGKLEIRGFVLGIIGFLLERVKLSVKKKCFLCCLGSDYTGVCNCQNSPNRTFNICTFNCILVISQFKSKVNFLKKRWKRSLYEQQERHQILRGRDQGGLLKDRYLTMCNIKRFTHLRKERRDSEMENDMSKFTVLADGRTGNKTQFSASSPRVHFLNLLYWLLIS